MAVDFEICGCVMAYTLLWVYMVGVLFWGQRFCGQSCSWGGIFLPALGRARNIGRPPDRRNRAKISLQASRTSIFARFSLPCEL